jgi:hypothetical protein
MIPGITARNGRVDPPSKGEGVKKLNAKPLIGPDFFTASPIKRGF